MSELHYTRPFLYAKQERAIFSSKRWRLCEASTKSGKTVASIAQIIEWALMGNGIEPVAPGQHYWWVAPVSSQAAIAYERVKNNLTKGTFTPKDSPTPHIFIPTGTIIDFKSADNPDSLYGEDVFGAIIDEAPRCRSDAWYAVRSTLTATRGPAVMIGNVKGRKNWFYEWCRRVEAGMDPNASFMRITWRDAVEAGVLDIEEIEDARRNLPEFVFRELYEAVASEDGGNPFGEDHILACVRERLSEKPPVAFGIDLAKRKDYLVLIGLDEDGEVCVFQRWTGIPWRESIRRIHEIVGEDIPALVDSTGVGDPVLEELQVGHGNFFGYNFSLASKQRLMEGLAVSIQGHEIGFPDGPIKTELLAFEYEMTRVGVRYSAPEGYSDDCVCALALARQQWTETAPGENVVQYMIAQGERERALRAKQTDSELRAETLEMMPWREPASVGEEFLNELTQLYESTLKSHPQFSRQIICRSCGKEVSGPSRVTDGAFVWHPECAGFGVH